ncbi:ATP-binding protein [Streptomyces colonosanans]|uniref:ATP-binding protein n=1 Tax=Streptomyces colonosanans TaxID=1428652 RepID=A0A1S2PBI1_9ACTN|nr:ATP-binding protein [Streptomyces colonosanans]OIJ91199.1 ATP-binding protein [Streptomyces colonosanans]
MKQSAAKTLGVAALGAAFAAAGAGVAGAAPAVPDVPGMNTARHAMPPGNVAQVLPGAGEVVSQGQKAVGTAVTAARPAAQRVVTQPTAGLLGGLPVKGLPTHGLPVNGIPLG